MKLEKYQRSLSENYQQIPNYFYKFILSNLVIINLPFHTIGVYPTVIINTHVPMLETGLIILHTFLICRLLIRKMRIKIKIPG